jgi:hypothetical protein
MRVSVATRFSRTSRRARATSCTLALACASIASVARAAPEPIALHYEAVAGCPKPEFFAGQVTARTDQVRFDEAGAVGSFRVVMERTASGYAGVLSVTDRNGKESVRRFEAESCDNVVVALALVAALAIDPNAVATPEAPAVPPAGAPPEQAPASAPVPDARETEPTTRVNRAPSAPALVFDRQFAPGPSAYRAWSWSVGATAQGLGGVTPSLLEVFGGFFGVEKKGVGWSPGFRLSPYYGATGQTGPSVDRAEFALLAARVAGCPYRAPLTKGSRVSPCAGLDAGWIRARGTDPGIHSLEKDGLWLSLSLDAQLELAVTGAIFMEVNGGLGVPLIRQRFQFETPDKAPEVVYQVPPVSGHGGFSVGARFP